MTDNFNSEFDEPLTPEEEKQISGLTPEQTEQIIEGGLFAAGLDDDGFDAALGLFRPEHPRWRAVIEGGTLKLRSRLKERKLKAVNDETKIKALRNSYLFNPDLYLTEPPLTESTICWYPDNSTMLLYLKGHIPLRTRSKAQEGLDAMIFDDPSRAETRNATAFNARLGTPVTVAGELLFGFMDHGTITMTNPTRAQAPQYEKLAPLMKRLNALFARTLPREFGQQNRLIHSGLRQFGTAFSTVSILKSCPSAIHRDAGNAKTSQQSLTCLTVVGNKEEYNGGEFCLLEYGLKIPVRPGDVLIAATSREWHLNLTPVKGLKYSLICYFRHGLASPVRLNEWRNR
jgi:hypothetical protein